MLYVIGVSEFEFVKIDFDIYKELDKDGDLIDRLVVKKIISGKPNNLSTFFNNLVDARNMLDIIIKNAESIKFEDFFGEEIPSVDKLQIYSLAVNKKEL